MSLRGYQEELVVNTRTATLGRVVSEYLKPDGSTFSASRRVRSVLVQLPTGGGKTAVASEIIRSAYLKGRRVWFVVPRNELADQGSNHLTKWGVPHGLITAGREESRAFRVHVVSKDTLLRRLARIKDWPDLLVFDEAHIAMDAQLKIIAAADADRSEVRERMVFKELDRQNRAVYEKRTCALPQMLVVGQTATPERMDGRGLWSGAGGPYDTIVMGPSIPWLTERGFLSPLRYFAPPIDGLDKLKWKAGEVDADDLEALLKAKKVYGDVVDYYKRYGVNADGTRKPFLGFCRSVHAAEEVAKAFRDAGFRVMSIDGTMGMKERRGLIDGLRSGALDGLTSCDLTTYGLDVPRVEYGFSLRPTLSRALYFQMVGRILRPYIRMRCPVCGKVAEGFYSECPACHAKGMIVEYEKKEALFFDHVNMILEHQDQRYPSVPLFKVDDLDWNFKGVTRRKRAKVDKDALRLCPHLDYQYCDRPTCAGCDKRKPGEIDPRQEVFKVVDTELEERKGPTHMADLEPEERREVQDRIGRATDEALAAPEGEIAPGPIGELLAVAEELGHAPMWVYWHLTEAENKRRHETGHGDRLTVNVPLLYEIARQKGYQRGWAWHKQQDIKKGIKEKEGEAVV
jgi:superfamily II DNA or RNA helicase